MWKRIPIVMSKDDVNTEMHAAPVSQSVSSAYSSRSKTSPLQPCDTPAADVVSHLTNDGNRNATSNKAAGFSAVLESMLSNRTQTLAIDEEVTFPGRPWMNMSMTSEEEEEKLYEGMDDYDEQPSCESLEWFERETCKVETSPGPSCQTVISGLSDVSDKALSAAVDLSQSLQNAVGVMFSELDKEPEKEELSLVKSKGQHQKTEEEERKMSHRKSVEKKTNCRSMSKKQKGMEESKKERVSKKCTSDRSRDFDTKMESNVDNDGIKEVPGNGQIRRLLTTETTQGVLVSTAQVSGRGSGNDRIKAVERLTKQSGKGQKKPEGKISNREKNKVEKASKKEVGKKSGCGKSLRSRVKIDNEGVGNEATLQAIEAEKQKNPKMARLKKMLSPVTNSDVYKWRQSRKEQMVQRGHSGLSVVHVKGEQKGGDEPCDIVKNQTSDHLGVAGMESTIMLKHEPGVVSGKTSDASVLPSVESEDASVRVDIVPESSEMLCLDQKTTPKHYRKKKQTGICEKGFPHGRSSTDKVLDTFDCLSAQDISKQKNQKLALQMKRLSGDATQDKKNEARTEQAVSVSVLQIKEGQKVDNEPLVEDQTPHQLGMTDMECTILTTLKHKTGVVGCETSDVDVLPPVESEHESIREGIIPESSEMSSLEQKKQCRKKKQREKPVPSKSTDAPKLACRVKRVKQTDICEKGLRRGRSSTDKVLETFDSVSVQDISKQSNRQLAKQMRKLCGFTNPDRLRQEREKLHDCAEQTEGRTEQEESVQKDRVRDQTENADIQSCDMGYGLQVEISSELGDKTAVVQTDQTDQTDRSSHSHSLLSLSVSHRLCNQVSQMGCEAGQTDCELPKLKSDYSCDNNVEEVQGWESQGLADDKQLSVNSRDSGRLLVPHEESQMDCNDIPNNDSQANSKEFTTVQQSSSSSQKQGYYQSAVESACEISKSSSQSLHRKSVKHKQPHLTAKHSKRRRLLDGEDGVVRHTNCLKEHEEKVADMIVSVQLSRSHQASGSDGLTSLLDHVVYDQPDIHLSQVAHCEEQTTSALIQGDHSCAVTGNQALEGCLSYTDDHEHLEEGKDTTCEEELVVMTPQLECDSLFGTALECSSQNWYRQKPSLQADENTSQPEYCSVSSSWTEQGHPVEMSRRHSRCVEFGQSSGGMVNMNGSDSGTTGQNTSQGKMDCSPCEPMKVTEKLDMVFLREQKQCQLIIPRLPSIRIVESPCDKWKQRGKKSALSLPHDNASNKEDIATGVAVDSSHEKLVWRQKDSQQTPSAKTHGKQKDTQKQKQLAYLSDKKRGKAGAGSLKVDDDDDIPLRLLCPVKNKKVKVTEASHTATENRKQTRPKQQMNKKSMALSLTKKGKAPAIGHLKQPVANSSNTTQPATSDTLANLKSAQKVRKEKTTKGIKTRETSTKCDLSCSNKPMKELPTSGLPTSTRCLSTKDNAQTRAGETGKKAKLPPLVPNELPVVGNVQNVMKEGENETRSEESKTRDRGQKFEKGANTIKSQECHAGQDETITDNPCLENNNAHLEMTATNEEPQAKSSPEVSKSVWLADEPDFIPCYEGDSDDDDRISLHADDDDLIEILPSVQEESKIVTKSTEHVAKTIQEAEDEPTIPSFPSSAEKPPPLLSLRPDLVQTTLTNDLAMLKEPTHLQPPVPRAPLCPPRPGLKQSKLANEPTHSQQPVPRTFIPTKPAPVHLESIGHEFLLSHGLGSPRGVQLSLKEVDKLFNSHLNHWLCDKRVCKLSLTTVGCHWVQRPPFTCRYEHYTMERLAEHIGWDNILSVFLNEFWEAQQNQHHSSLETPCNASAFSQVSATSGPVIDRKPQVPIQGPVHSEPVVCVPSSSLQPFVNHLSTSGVPQQPVSVLERWSHMELQRQVGNANAKNYFNLLVEITESTNPNFKVGMDCLKRLGDLGCQSGYEFGLMITALCQHQKVEKAYQMFMEMVEKQFVPPSECMHCLLEASLAKSNRVTEIMEFVQRNDLLDKNIASLLVNYFYQNKGTCSEQLWSLVNEIEMKQIHLSLDVYRRLLRMFSEIKSISGIVSVLKCDPRVAIVPYLDAQLVNDSITLALEQKIMDAAMFIYSALSSEQKYQLTANTWASLFVAFCNYSCAPHVEAARSFICAQPDIEWTKDMYCSYIRWLCRCSRALSAYELYNEMMHNVNITVEESVSYELVEFIVKSARQLKTAHELAVAVLRKGMKLSSELVTDLLDRCQKQKQFVALGDILLESVRAGVRIELSRCGILMDLLFVECFDNGRKVYMVLRRIIREKSEQQDNPALLLNFHRLTKYLETPAWDAAAAIYCDAIESSNESASLGAREPTVRRGLVAALVQDPSKSSSLFRDLVVLIKTYRQEDSGVNGDLSSYQLPENDHVVISRIGLELMATCKQEKLWDEGYRILFCLHSHRLCYKKAVPFHTEREEMSACGMALLAVEFCLQVQIPEKAEALRLVLESTHWAVPVNAHLEPREVEERVGVLKRVAECVLKENQPSIAIEALRRIACEEDSQIPSLCSNLIAYGLDNSHYDIYASLEAYNIAEQHQLRLEPGTLALLVTKLAATDRLPLARQVFSFGLTSGALASINNSDRPCRVSLQPDFSEIMIEFAVERQLSVMAQCKVHRSEPLTVEVLLDGDDGSAVSRITNVLSTRLTPPLYAEEFTTSSPVELVLTRESQTFWFSAHPDAATRWSTTRVVAESPSSASHSSSLPVDFGGSRSTPMSPVHWGFMGSASHNRSLEGLSTGDGDTSHGDGTDISLAKKEMLDKLKSDISNCVCHHLTAYYKKKQIETLDDFRQLASKITNRVYEMERQFAKRSGQPAAFSDASSEEVIRSITKVFKKHHVYRRNRSDKE